MLRPIGSGLPLGFFSFGIGMLLLACQAIGWISVGEQRDVGLLLASFVFPLELVATVFAFLARDTLAATTLGLFTTSWLALGLAELTTPAGSTSLGKPFFSALLGLAAVRMVIAGTYEVGGSKTLYHVAGGCALALAALAMYGGAALSLEDAGRRGVLPLFRRGQAEESFAGYQAQLEQLEYEPGVRQQL